MNTRSRSGARSGACKGGAALAKAARLLCSSGGGIMRTPAAGAWQTGAACPCIMLVEHLLLDLPFSIHALLCNVGLPSAAPWLPPPGA